MTNLQIFIQMILKIGFILPILLSLIGWGIVEEIEKKWEAR